MFAALATVVVFAMHGPCCLARACAMAAPAIPVLMHAIQAVSLSRGAAPPAHPPPRPSTLALSLLRQGSTLLTPCASPPIPTTWMGPTPRCQPVARPSTSPCTRRRSRVSPRCGQCTTPRSRVPVCVRNVASTTTATFLGQVTCTGPMTLDHAGVLLLVPPRAQTPSALRVALRALVPWMPAWAWP